MFVAEFVEQLPTIVPANISSGVAGKQNLKIPSQRYHEAFQFLVGTNL